MSQFAKNESNPQTAGGAVANVQRHVGKSTLVEQMDVAAGRATPVQQRGGDSIDVHRNAAAGTAGPGGPLPFAHHIQQLFGRHDITGVRAHTDQAAADASASMGARAYARGNDVAFGGAPDLHTAAHEAAHVVQQRAGVQLQSGVGQQGDAYEHHADAVADKVVAGESAEALLSTMAPATPHGGATAGDAVQRIDLGPGSKADKVGETAGAAEASTAGEANKAGEVAKGTQASGADGQEGDGQDAWKTQQGWASKNVYDPAYTGQQEVKVTEISKQQLYDAITKVAPSLPHEFKCMLVGHAWIEQQGKHIINNNFAGVEGSSSAFVKVWTSTHVTAAEVTANPDKYRDWDMNGHNPNYGTYKGKPAGTIKCQLEQDPVPDLIVVCAQKPRPAYQTLESAAAAFVHLIELRIHALQESKDASHQQLAEAALSGDENAYGKIVNGSFKITDAAGKNRSFGAYNGDKGSGKHDSYGDRVANSIKQTTKDLADNANAAPSDDSEPAGSVTGQPTGATSQPAGPPADSASHSGAMSTLELLTALATIDEEIAGLAGAEQASKQQLKQDLQRQARTRPLHVAVQVISTEDIIGADDVYVRVRNAIGGNVASPQHALNNGDSFIFDIPLGSALPGQGALTIEVFDGDWPDSDDLLVTMTMATPFAAVTNSATMDGANYSVRAYFD